MLGSVVNIDEVSVQTKSRSSLAANNTLYPFRNYDEHVEGLPEPDRRTDQAHPPIFLKLNPSSLQMLVSGAKPPEIKLTMHDASAALQVGEFEYQGKVYKEPGYLEVYLPEDGQESSYRSHGQIKNRFAIKQDKPMKLGFSGAVDLTQPTEAKIVRLLELRPISLVDLASKTQASRSLVQSVIDQVAEVSPTSSAVTGELYTIKPEFRKPPDARQEVSSAKRESSGSSQELKQMSKAQNTAKQSASMASGPKQAGPKQDPSGSNSGAPAGTSKKDVKPDVRKDAKREQKVEGPSRVSHGSIPAPVSANSGASSSGTSTTGMRNGAVKRRTTPEPSLSAAKRLRSEAARPDEDMFELARKFKSAYSEYLELYSVLSKRKSRPQSQVQRLMQMHKKLERWKNTLWSSARSRVR